MRPENADLPPRQQLTSMGQTVPLGPCRPLPVGCCSSCEERNSSESRLPEWEHLPRNFRLLSNSGRNILLLQLSQRKKPVYLFIIFVLGKTLNLPVVVLSKISKSYAGAIPVPGYMILLDCDSRDHEHNNENNNDKGNNRANS